MQNTESYEVELRAILSDDELKRVVEFCEQNGELVSKDNRFLVDYSTFLEGITDRTKDIRVRSTNGKREIIVKQGDFAAASRIESNVYVSSSLQDLMTIMALLGYEKGVTAIRNITRYQVGEIEIAICEARIYSDPTKLHSTYVELEILTDKANQDQAKAKLKNLMDTLKLKPLTAKKFYEYIEQLNAEANGVFEYEKADWKKIEKLGN